MTSIPQWTSFFCFYKNHGSPIQAAAPVSLKYDLFVPSQQGSKCATYVWKDLNLQAKVKARYHNCSISVTMLINNRRMKFINVYSPSKNETQDFLENHHPLPNCFLSGDFNTHHASWYWERAISSANLIRSCTPSPSCLTEWTSEQGMTLLSIPNHLTHFPHNGSSPSITFANHKLGSALQG